MSNKHKEFKKKYEGGFTSENIDAALIDFNDTFCVYDSDSKAIERTHKEQTKKGYDTTGIKLPFIWNDLIRVFGPTNVDLVVESESNAKVQRSKGDAHEICMTVKIRIRSGPETILAEQWAYGGHIARMLGDAYKGALTNGTKKALSLLGIGLGAWMEMLDEDAVAPISDEYATADGHPVSSLTWEQFKLELAKVLDEYERTIGTDPYEKYFTMKSGDVLDRKSIVRFRERSASGKRDYRKWFFKVYKQAVNEIRAFEKDSEGDDEFTQDNIDWG